MLFGHQSDDAKPAGIITTAPTDDVSMPGVNPLAVDPDTGVSLPTAPPPPSPTESDDMDTPSSVLNQPMPASQPVSEPEPAADKPIAPPPIADITPGTGSSVPAYSNDAPLPPPVTTPQPDDNDDDDDTSDDTVPANEVNADDTTTTVPATDDLLALKQQALTQLGPLVDQLDQTPEERFRTTMMLIQSTDDSSRIPEAYKAAQAITDEKVRAQALLDVVNEINYFTQGQHANSQPDQPEQPETAL